MMDDVIEILLMCFVLFLGVLSVCTGFAVAVAIAFLLGVLG
jgi:hypothetical protein